MDKQNFTSTHSEIILASIKQIQVNHDWRMFDDLVLNNPDNRHIAQYKYLADSLTVKESVLHAGNGWGKTDIFAKKHIYKILSHLGDRKAYQTCQTALTLDQAIETQERIEEIVSKSPMLDGWFITKAVKHPLPEIRYFNQAKTIFRTTKNKAQAIEGKQFGYIGADEVAMEPHLEFIREKVFLPRIRRWRDSQVEYAATPKGKNAYFRVSQAVKRAGGCVCGGSSYDNPYIDHKLLDYITENWNDLKKKQIIEGQFIDNSLMPFAGRLDKLFNRDLELTEAIQKNHTYFEAWDLARGRTSENDMTFGYRIDSTQKPYLITQKWSFQLPWTEQGRQLLMDKGYKFDSSIEAKIRQKQKVHGGRGFVDSTGIGDTLSEMVQDIMQGVDFRGKKDKLIEHAQACIDQEAIKSPYIPELADQMSTYMIDDKDLDTDAIMAFVIGMKGVNIINRSIEQLSSLELGLD